MTLFNRDLQVRPDHVFSITNIPFEDFFFDWVICSHVLDDVEDDKGALAELYRVLKHGGRALIAVPFDPELKTTIELVEPETAHLRCALCVGWEDKRRYGLDFVDRLENAGFATQVLEPIKCFDVSKYGLLKTDFVFVGTKGSDKRDNEITAR